MYKIIFIILAELFIISNDFAQQKTYGYRISGNGDIVSDVFLIQDGFVLDSISRSNKTYSFEYDENGRLKRDINFITFTVLEGTPPRKITVPGSRDYFYNERGDVDSMLYGKWIGGQWLSDSSGESIDYVYDDDGKILKETGTSNGEPALSEEYSYDLHGNLILKTTSIFYSGLTQITDYYREYDEQNRLAFTKTVDRQYPLNYTQYIYQYDPSGNINCTEQTVADTLVTNTTNWYLEFDESGKLVKETQSTIFLSDSTWANNLEIVWNYDEFGRILNRGKLYLFQYNADGNPDTLMFLHHLSNYLKDKATFVDSYGNIITLPSYTDVNYLYYSKIVTGLKKGKANDMNFTLSQNYPNPFNPSTIINYQLPTYSNVKLVIYDVIGREVKTLIDRKQRAGRYSITFNANGLSSGVYIYKFNAGSFVQSRKMILLH